MEYRCGEKLAIYLGLMVLGMAAGGLIIGIPITKSTKKSMKGPLRIPPLPVPPAPLPIETSGNQRINVLAGLTTASLLASVALFIESQSIELLVEQLKGITPQAAYDFIAELIKRPRAMDADEVIQVTYGIITFFLQDSAQREYVYRLLDLVYTVPQLQKRSPLLVIAARSSYAHVIPLIIHWAKSRNILQQCLNESLLVIARTCDTSMLKKLERYGVALTPERATYILWHALDHVAELNNEDHEDLAAQSEAKKNFINFLIEKKADINYHDKGYTLLMQATKHNDLMTMEQLLRHGADVNRIVDDSVGSSLQLAIQYDFLDAELLLRQYHAHE